LACIPARHERENAGVTEAQQGRPSEQRRERTAYPRLYLASQYLAPTRDVAHGSEIVILHITWESWQTISNTEPGEMLDPSD